MKRYQVLVGNLGYVFDSDSGIDARKEYRAWIAVSKKGYGRAGGEPVSLFKNDEIQEEYVPEVP